MLPGMIRSRWWWFALLTCSAAIAVGGVLAYAALEHAEQLNPYAGYQFAIGLACAPVGAFVVWHRPEQRIGWILWVAGIAVWTTFAASIGLDWLGEHTTLPGWVLRTILHLGSPGWLVTRGCLLVLVPLAFPDSRPSRPWGRALWWSGIGCIVITAAAHSRVFTFEHFQGRPPSAFERFAADVELWGQRSLWVLAIAASCEMLLRVGRVPTAERRQQRLFAIVIVVALVPSAIQVAGQAFDLQLSWWDDRFELWADIALPLTLALGVVRHSWFDIRVVVRKATLYLTLTAIAAAAYAVIVSTFSVFLASSTTTSVVTATGVIAVGSVPLYTKLDRMIGRWLFGTRDLPYETVAALGQRLEHAPQGDDALQLVVETVARHLRLPFVAIDLALESGDVRVASFGTPAEATESFAMAFRGDTLGQLVVAPRTESERFTVTEMQLLDDLARQAGVVAHAARVAEELRQSKVLVVAAREEERRRLRVDLHDGLGPTLASVALGLGVAAERLDNEPELSRLLRDLDAELQLAITEIRRVVHALRPPTLDELGLVGAIAQHAQRLSERSGGSIEVVVDAPDLLPPLSAAVEVAAYRVALESITNVVRHSGASRCNVSIRCDRDFSMAITDNGQGFAEATNNGVGLRSIRGVADAGGKVLVSSTPRLGTRVDVRLPLEETA